MRNRHSYIINFRVSHGSKREEKVLELAQEYGVQPSCRLLDRIIEDAYNIIAHRARERLELAEMERDMVERKRALAAGERDQKKEGLR